MPETQPSGSRDRQPPKPPAPPVAGRRGGRGGGNDELKGRPLGRILIKMGKLNRGQVGEALDLQKERDRPIGQVLISLGYVNESDIHSALTAQEG